MKNNFYIPKLVRCVLWGRKSDLLRPVKQTWLLWIRTFIQ